MSDRNRKCESVGDILPRVLEQWGLMDRQKHEDVASVWREIAGPLIASHTHMGSLKAGCLTIDVTSAPLQQELTMFRKEELLKALRERLEGVFVEELRFRLV